MPAPEVQSAVAPDEAFAALAQLAEAFLGGSRGSPEGSVARSDNAGSRSPATMLVDEHGVIRGLDREAERLLARQARDVVGLPAVAVLGNLAFDVGPFACQLRGEDGAAKTVWVTRSELTLERDTCVVLTLDEHDPAGERQTELRYRHLVEQIPAVVFTAALDGGLYDLYVSPQIENLLGYSQKQWVADPVLWYERLHPDDRRRLDQEFAKGCMTGGPFRADCRFLTLDDKVVWVHGEARLIKDARGLPLLLQGVAFDITETKRAEEVARASLREKETLLKEIHHRVKNNLQVTSSLLRLQAERIDNESARKALREGQGRIRSMALVHELLYQSGDLSKVDLGEYIRELTRQLLRSHAVDPSKVDVQTKLVLVPLPIDVAVPCGLILNELVSNALKHAFPDGTGTITIELQRGEGCDELVVRDDGVGMALDKDFLASPTLGLRLVQTLAAQIGAKLVAHSSGGTEFRLQIPTPREH